MKIIETVEVVGFISIIITTLINNLIIKIILTDSTLITITTATDCANDCEIHLLSY